MAISSTGSLPGSSETSNRSPGSIGPVPASRLPWDVQAPGTHTPDRDAVTAEGSNWLPSEAVTKSCPSLSDRALVLKASCRPSGLHTGKMLWCSKVRL